MPSAKLELKNIKLTIAKDNPGAAKKVIDGIKAAINRLKNNPRLGYKQPQFNDDTKRQLVHGNYIIYYEITESSIVIFDIVHGSKLRINN